jgi:hypothetical protein
MEVIKTIKKDLTIKEARIMEGQIVDECGEVVNVAKIAEQLYGEDGVFKLALTASTKEEIEINIEEDDEE